MFASLEDEESDARLLPYIYTYSGDDGRYIVVASRQQLRILGMDGSELARFTQDAMPFFIDMPSCRARQLNALLIITSAADMPLELKMDANQQWSLSYYEFDEPPWRYENEQRDESILVSATAGEVDTIYDVDFSQVSDEKENAVEDNDTLRFSYYMPQQEAFAEKEELIARVEERQDARPVATLKGTKICHPFEMTTKYYVCKQEWPADVYCPGLDLPENYPDNFQAAEDLSSYAGLTPHWSVRDAAGGGAMAKNKKFAIRMGYWKYYTCIKDFAEADFVDGASTYDDYPDFFLPGVSVGEALPCRGEWEFWCSGVWYGSYMVIRNYESASIYNAGWETAGVSISRNADATNTQVTGDESDEVCYLRLMLTSSRRISTTGITSGFPSDACGNRLIVQGYRHDATLERRVVYDENDNVLSSSWRCPDKVQATWFGQKRISNWSWRAFSARYGYPRICEVFDQRLVFAATDDQPQSLWFSRTDDLRNFSAYEGDDSAIAITLATTTQNPICWLQAQAACLCLGTCEGEFVVSGTASGGAVLTPANITVQGHGHIGSDENLSLVAADKVLFIERGGGRCYDYGYSYEVDGFRSSDLTVLAPHILSEHGGAVDCTLLRKPDTVAVFPLADGQVALCTYVPMQQVNAWHRWTTDGSVLRACALPNGTASDRLFLIVERDGERAIEVVDDDSPFFDGYGADYTSTLISNATFNAMEAPVGKRKMPAVGFLFGVDAPVENMQVCSDGGDEWTAATHSTPTLPAGWHKLVTISNWSYENKIGFRVWGDNDASLLALQG